MYGKIRRVPYVAAWVVAYFIGSAVGAGAAEPAAANPAPAASSEITCNSTLSPTRTAGGSLEVSQGKSWQPRGGEIQFKITTTAALPPDALIKVCVQWRHPRDEGKLDYVEAPGTHVVDFKAADKQSITIAATVPELPWAPGDVERTGVYTVPLSDLRVLIYDNKNQIHYDVRGVIGITMLPVAIALSVLTVVVTFALLTLIIGRNLRQLSFGSGRFASVRRAVLGLISTEKGYASLSQLQIVLWTFVVAGSAVYVMALSGELINVTSGTLILLGISGGTTVLSKFKSALDDTKNPAPAAPAVVRVPRWSDLVINFQKQPDGTYLPDIDVTRVQMLLFTIITASFALIKVATSYEIPEIPTGFLTLMGISNGVYLGSKYAD